MKSAKEMLENYHKQILKFAEYYCWYITLNQELEELKWKVEE